MLCFTSWNDRIERQFEAIEEDYSVIESMGIENIDFINEEYFQDKGANHFLAYYSNDSDKTKTKMLKEMADEAQQTLFARQILNLVEDYKEIAEQMYWEDEVYEMEQIEKQF